MALLAFERSFVELTASAQRILNDLILHVRSMAPSNGMPDSRHAMLRSQLAELALEIEISRLHVYKVAWMEDAGMIPESEAAMSKLFGSEVLQRVAIAGMRVLGLSGQLQRESQWAKYGGTIERAQLATLGSTIYAGASEIQRNVIATRGLGLPR